MNKYGFGGRLTEEFPSQINVDLTELCNLNCIHCSHEDFMEGGEYSSLSLSTELNKKMVDEVAKENVEYIRYTASGEPLLHKKFRDILSYGAENSGTQVTLTTNGTLLDRDTASFLISLGLSSVDISIDAASEDTYQKIRRRGNFKTVTDNVHNLIAEKNRSNSDIKVVVSFVNQPLNSHEAEEFKDYWEEKGADYVVIRRLHSAGNTVEEISRSLKSQIITERKPCLYPWERIMLKANGFLCYCPNSWGSLGELVDYRHTTIKEAWSSEDYNRLRSAHLCCDFSHYEHCGDCPDWINTRWPWEGRSYADMMSDFK